MNSDQKKTGDSWVLEALKDHLRGISDWNFTPTDVLSFIADLEARAPQPVEIVESEEDRIELDAADIKYHQICKKAELYDQMKPCPDAVSRKGVLKALEASIYRYHGCGLENAEIHLKGLRQAIKDSPPILPTCTEEDAVSREAVQMVVTREIKKIFDPICEEYDIKGIKLVSLVDNLPPVLPTRTDGGSTLDQRRIEAAILYFKNYKQDYETTDLIRYLSGQDQDTWADADFGLVLNEREGLVPKQSEGLSPKAKERGE